MPQEVIPKFWSHLDRQMSLEARGLAASWIAPVAKIVAPEGFDESCWIDAIPDTVVSMRLGGAHVSKAMGSGSGTTTARGGNFTLQPKGTPLLRSSGHEASSPASEAEFARATTLRSLS